MNQNVKYPKNVFIQNFAHEGNPSVSVIKGNEVEVSFLLEVHAIRDVPKYDHHLLFSAAECCFEEAK